jgi:hypothetical protein
VAGDNNEDKDYLLIGVYFTTSLKRTYPNPQHRINEKFSAKKIS